MQTFSRLSTAVCAIVAMAVLPAAVFAQGFGAGVAVSGDQVLIGERGGPTSSGMVHVYGRAGEGWDILSTVVPGDADVSGFGSALSVSGDRMIVGASGVAYVFDHDGDGWTQTGMLTAMPPEGLTFGSRVTIDGDRALVAAGSSGGRYGRGPSGPAGTVYVFERGDGGWTQPAELTSSAAAAGDGFGSAMALRGPYAVIGTPRASAGNARLAGSVTLFNRQDDGSWVQVGDPLVAPDAAQGGSFGSAVYPYVTEDGATLFVGATGAAGGSGSVYSFSFDEGSWTPVNRFFPPVTTVTRRRRFGGGGFGSSVTVVDDELWIGTGTQVLRYTQSDGNWMPSMSLSGSTVEGNAGFGARIAAGGEIAVVAATAKDNGMGTAFIFERGSDGWSESAEVWTEPTNYT
ncbi:MAG: FG-GAP repeat protein, partial [Gemmatimonadota bacterium]